MQTVEVKVWFSEVTPQGIYSDTLYFSPEEWDQTTQEQVDSIKQERIEKWVEFVAQASLVSEEITE